MKLERDKARGYYEINVALFDAMRGTLQGEDSWQIERFICAHAIMLAMEGIPAFYIHSLLSTENDYRRVELSQHNRAINRHQWDSDELESALADPLNNHAQVLSRLRKLIALRRSQPAFHPNGPQFTLQLGDAIVALWRQSLDGNQHIFAISNITDHSQSVSLSAINLPHNEEWRDLLSDQVYNDRMGTLELQPYQTAWLAG